MRPKPRPGVVAALVAAAAIAALGASAPGAAASVLPSGFQDTTVFSGLHEPTKLRFAPDGRAFIAERKGKVLVFDSLSDKEPTVFADLSEMVYDRGDRGILGMALDPKFEEGRPYVYVLYTFNHLLGEEAPPPKWEGESTEGDPCPAIEGSSETAEELRKKGMDCPVSGRLVRLTAEGDHAKANGEGKPEEKVLVEDWCQQYDSHSIGDLQFDSEGNLYASAGEGANYTSPDYGQDGLPEPNQCGDPPGEVGEALTVPTAEGGSLRAQNPENLDGTVIRVNPDTGQGLPGNPLYSSLDENEKRVVAEGFRNPFRFAIDPETHEVYVGNVGWSTWEEIDRFAPPLGETTSQIYNSGWPCYEGPEETQGFKILGLNVCESLYSTPGSTSPPFYAYEHGEPLTPYDPCESQYGSVINGITFYEGSAFPSAYEGALFFSDGARQCIYVMFPGENGRPDPSTVTPFLTYGGLYPTAVDLEEGPEGDLYYVNLFGPSFDANAGTVHRISYSSGNQPPVAQLSVDHEYGPEPLGVEFDASGSTDPDSGEELTYEWDLEGNGEFHPGGPTATKTFNDGKSENHTVAVRVEDEHEGTSLAQVTVYPGDTPPVPEIIAPSPSLMWHVGQSIEFEGAASDAEEGSLLPTSLDWSSLLKHCPSSCHVHPLQAFPGVASGTIVAPEHDYPSGIDLTLTATDSRGLSASKTIELEPEAVEVEFESVPSGVGLSAGLVSEEAPFSFKAIKGSNLLLVAPTTTAVGETTYAFQAWSDGGERSHGVTANADATYTAEYEAPEAALTPSQSWNGSGELEVEFDASGSSGESLEYEWDTGSGFEAASGESSKTIPVADESPHTVKVRVKEPSGATDVAEKTVQAVELQLHSSPGGVSLKAATVEKTAPFQIFALQGSELPLEAPESFESGSKTYKFNGWSDGEPRTHSIIPTEASTYTATYSAPTAQLELAASPQSWNGSGELEVEFDASGSSGESLEYEWDPEGDGSFEAASPESTKKLLVEAAGEPTVKVRVKDSHSATDVAEETIQVVALGLASEPSGLPLKAATVEKTAPFTLLALQGSSIGLEAPAESTLGPTEYLYSSWSDGEPRTHSVTASSSATYTAHYTEYVSPTASLATPSQSWNGSGELEVEFDASGSSGASLEYEWDTGSGFEAASGESSKTIPVADESPHTVKVRVEDSLGGSDEAEATIEAVALQIHSEPAGVSLKAATVEKTAPFQIFALQGSSIELGASAAATLGSTSYLFSAWSDGGARTHPVEPGAATTYTASFDAVPVVQVPPPVEPPLAPLATEIETRPAKVTRRAFAKFAFSVANPGARFYCKLDRQRFRRCHSPRVYRHLKPGKHILRLFSTYRGMRSDRMTYRWRVLPRHHRHG